MDEKLKKLMDSLYNNLKNQVEYHKKVIKYIEDNFKEEKEIDPNDDVALSSSRHDRYDRERYPMHYQNPYRPPQRSGFREWISDHKLVVGIIIVGILWLGVRYYFVSSGVQPTNGLLKVLFG